ncbi:hypothetical protein AQUCO_01400528v1 [Aquilegia coerulea]|uniref:Uncharacterized protein n=1 Tax=Aquilegia coerulea TaxID=218851 RepID=A0A2G5DX16_AQUCA|nr:hypothetical protein AQUCO_01400528v1 [Aquilegia coerulea]
MGQDRKILRETFTCTKSGLLDMQFCDIIPRKNCSLERVECRGHIFVLEECCCWTRLLLLSRFFFCKSGKSQLVNLNSSRRG